MIHQCANPGCGKPLHYLREGRIFVFDLPEQDVSSSASEGRRMRHFWLCGPCSEIMILEQCEGMEIRVHTKTGKVETGRNEILPEALAS